MPVKYLSNFLRALRIPLINCEISLDLRWSKHCALTSKATREADPDANPAILELITQQMQNLVLKTVNYMFL